MRSADELQSLRARELGPHSTSIQADDNGEYCLGEMSVPFMHRNLEVVQSQCLDPKAMNALSHLLWLK